MKASVKIRSNGVWVSDNVEKRFETDIYILFSLLRVVALMFGNDSSIYYPS
jgi:hypothetical protein